MGDTTATAVPPSHHGGRGARSRRRALIVTATVAGLMLVAAVGWACTVGQMKGSLWFSGPTGTNLIADGPNADLGTCPTDSSQQVDTGYATGDVVCVQADRLQVFRTGGSTPDPENDGHFMRLYELKYASAYEDARNKAEGATGEEPPDPLTDEQEANLNGDLCHQSRQTLPNLSREDGLYKASTAEGNGWKDQKTVLDMPQGTYTVCAATVVPPAAGVMSGGVAGAGVPLSYFDAGPDGDPGTGHGSIIVTGSP